MRIHKKIGTKERLLEMFENVNKVKVNEAYDESHVDPIAAARTSGEESNRNSEFARLSANNFQPFKDEYGIPDDIFHGMSDDEKRQELVDYLSISESVNELDIPQSSIKQGVEFPIQMMDDTNFPHDQRLPSPDTSDASIRVSPSKWKALFNQKWGEEGSLVFDGTWWNVVGNDEFTNWKEGSTANKAAWLDKERSQGRTTEDHSVHETSYTDLAKSSGVDNPEVNAIKYNYDQMGNWIPVGYEDKKVALRPLEQPLGSDNWKVALVIIDQHGHIDDILDTKDTWEEAKNALHASIT